MFVRIPKTASTTVCHAIYGRQYGHEKASELDFIQWDYWRFSFVRGPYDRLVSAWKSGYRDSYPDFSEWVVNELPSRMGDTLLMPQSKWLDRPMHFIGRFEQLQAGVNYVLAVLGRSPVELPVMNATEGSAEYSSKARAVAGNLYAEDFERFRYAR